MQRAINLSSTFVLLLSMLASSFANAARDSGTFDLAERLAEPSTGTTQATSNVRGRETRAQRETTRAQREGTHAQRENSRYATESQQAVNRGGRTALPARLAANPRVRAPRNRESAVEQVDLFDALGTAKRATKSTKSNVEKDPRVATKVAILPNSNYVSPGLPISESTTAPQISPSRRRPPFASPEDLALDLISSTASSRDTGGLPSDSTLQAPSAMDLAGDELSLDAPTSQVPSPSDATAGANEHSPVARLGSTEIDAGSAASSSRQAENAFAKKDVETNSIPTDTLGTRNSSLPGRRALGENVLVSEKLPLIHSRIIGPSKILIGRESTYRVAIENRGSIAAKQLETEIRIPMWAEVIHANASVGTVSRSGEAGGERVLRWEVTSLGASRSETMDVVLVPKTSQPLSLGVSWRHAPVNSTAMVEVQEPKLSMAITGPEEVLFGRPQTYRLSITNPGTGAAENVFIQLMPPGGGQAVSSHRVASLAPGDAKVVDIEITAREPGELAIRAVATADGDLRAETEQQILCRKAELSVDWRGPSEKFAGTDATYYFRVRNPGTAPAEQVELEVTLPAGFEFKSASDGHRLAAEGRRVTWKIGSLRHGDDRYLELRGTVSQAGRNELQLSVAAADGNATDTKTAATEVVAIADLKLDVLDPKGPVAVGTEIDYEITVTNRGRNAAEAINIVGLFSAGIEPVEAIGAGATISDGRVGFQTIGTLPAGQQLRLKIRARALSAGTHLFRAEVVCNDLDIKLAAEETTRFYEDDTYRGRGGEQPMESASRASRFELAK